MDPRELYIRSPMFRFLQKGGWTSAQTENPPKVSALEMLENSLYSPAWEGRCLAGMEWGEGVHLGSQ